MLHVHSLESFGSVDGPGIRFVIFLKGCRMRCRYCHNPDTWAPGAKGGEAMTVGQLLDKAERYRSYWGKEGGITVSGGEALLQIDGLIVGASTPVSTRPHSPSRVRSRSMASFCG